MAVKSLKNSTLESFANYSSSMNAGYSFQDYELIESVFVASPTASVTFNNLDQYATDYKHLQIRAVFTSNLTNGIYHRMRFNGDTGSNYANHLLYGTNNQVLSGAYTSFTEIISSGLVSSSDSNRAEANVIDILDAYSTTKNKTVRVFSGLSQTTASNSNVGLQSAFWNNTASLTSIQLRALSQGSASNFVAGSRFSIYGIR